MTTTQPSSGAGGQPCARCGARHRVALGPLGECPSVARNLRIKATGLCRCGEPVRPGTTRCDSCHSDVRWTDTRFDHARARYADAPGLSFLQRKRTEKPNRDTSFLTCI